MPYTMPQALDFTAPPSRRKKFSRDWHANEYAAREAMSFIVYFFFLTYGAIHYYFFYKLRAAFQPSLLLASLIAVFFVIMVTAPVTVYFIERGAGPVLARVLAYIGYSWMGILFFVFW